MDHRIFGKELTNLLGPQHHKNHSLAVLQKNRDHSFDPHKPRSKSPHNRSLIQPRDNTPKF